MEVVWFACSGQAAEDQEALLGFSVPLELSESHPVSVALLVQVMTSFGVSSGELFQVDCSAQSRGFFLVFLILQPEASDPLACCPLLLAVPKPIRFFPGQFE